MEHYELIRRMVLVEGLSRREVARRLGHSRDTIQRALAASEPRPYTLALPRRQPVLASVATVIDAWLEADQVQPRKQRHTATRIHERLVAEHGFQGSRRAVSNYVRTARRQLHPPEVVVPIEHGAAEEFQIDWGEATIMLNGNRMVVMLFCARSAYSKATWTRAYARDNMTSFLDGHVRLFEYLGGVPARLAYDNLKSAVIRIGPGRQRDLNARFVSLRSHYLFASRFCNPARGNEKGHVENSVKRSQRTYMTPVPQVTTLAALNDHLLQQCQADLSRVDPSGVTYGELLAQERAMFRPLPQRPFPACQTQPARIDRHSTIIHEHVRYSVPIRFARLHSVVRSFIDKIQILVDNQVVAEHTHGQRGEWVLTLEHYLPLLERKPGLLDSGKPFKTSQWSDSQQLLRRELEFRLGDEGTRQFLRIILLSKTESWELLCQAIDRCVAQRAFHEEAIRLELAHLRRSDDNTSQDPRLLDLASHPQLQHCASEIRDPAIYDCLWQTRDASDLGEMESHESMTELEFVLSPMPSASVSITCLNEGMVDHVTEDFTAFSRSQFVGAATASAQVANDAQ